MKFKCVFVVFLCFLLIAMPVSAAFVESYDCEPQDVQEMQKQNEIDVIFSELNALALKKYKIINSVTEEDEKESLLDKIQKQEEIYNQQLEELGMDLLDPNDIHDIQGAKELCSSMQTYSVNSDDIDNFVNTLLQFFSVYRYDGTRVVNGTSYTYAYFRVVDNKGSYLYTRSMAAVDLLNFKPDVVSDLVQYNVEYLISATTDSIVGKIFEAKDMFDATWVVEWTLGNIFTGIKSANQNGKINESSMGNIYTATVTSITQMTYYFIYFPQYYQWTLIGSRANDVQLSLTEVFNLNVEGELINDVRSTEKSFFTGNAWHWYVDNFVNTNKPAHHTIGQYTFKGNNKEVYSFAPAYYYAPTQVLYE